MSNLSLNFIENKLQNSPMTWLITGVAGFIGSNLLEYLLKLNQRVIGLDNFITGKRDNLNDVKSLLGKEKWKNFKFIEGDIKNINICYDITKDVDLVLHQAALGSIPRSIKDPLGTHETNITGFLNMILASKKNKVKRFIFASSSSVYGDNFKIPKLEDNIGTPLSPYALTKLNNELYADIFSKIFEIEFIGLRYFNVFGKRQDPGGSYAAVIPKWINSILNNLPCYINGDGNTSRDFCFIDNVVQANILAAISNNPKSLNQIFNVAVGESITLNELYKEIKRIVKIKSSKTYDAPLDYRDFRHGDIRHSQADITKIKNILGYAPKFNINKGLEIAIDWYVDQIK